MCSDSRRPDVVVLNSENKAYLADMTCCKTGDNLKARGAERLRSVMTSSASSRRTDTRPFWMPSSSNHWEHGNRKTSTYTLAWDRLEVQDHV